MEDQAEVMLKEPAERALQPQGGGAAEGCADPPAYGRIKEAVSSCGVQDQDRNVGGSPDLQKNKLVEFCRQIDDGL